MNQKSLEIFYAAHASCCVKVVKFCEPLDFQKCTKLAYNFEYFILQYLKQIAWRSKIYQKYGPRVGGEYSREGARSGASNDSGK